MNRPLLAAAEAALRPAKHWKAVHRYRTGPLFRRYPDGRERLRSSRLMRAPWYYSVELLPGVVSPGRHGPELPLLPRMALRRCAVEGAACLDVGTMEGLVPALLAKRSAREVVSVDFSNHSLGKLDAVRHYHGVSFEYRSVGLIYDLGKRLRGRGFDVINLSGLLYHVFSPLMALAAVRPLLKRNGLLVVSTNVTLDRDYVADFNALGRLQGDLNTFWYPSARLFDYLLRYMRLEPIDCWFLPHTEVGGVTSIEKPTGYASVVCRAIDRVDGDAWMRASAREAWEYRGLCDWRRAGRQPLSDVKYRGTAGDGGIDVAEMIATTEPVRVPVAEDDSHLLRLDARS